MRLPDVRTPTRFRGFTPLLLLLAFGLMLEGCGGNAEDSRGRGGDGDASGDGDGDGDGDAPGDGDGDGDGDGNVCEGFENDSPGHLEIEIVNERSSTIYIGPRVSTCGTSPPFGVRDAEGTPLQTHIDSCVPTCEDYVNGNGLGCPAICLTPEMIVLEPGASRMAIWDTRIGSSETLPASCNAGDTEDTMCIQARSIQPGTVTFFSNAGTALACDTPCDDCGDECPGALVVSGAEVLAETMVDLDASYGIFPSPADSDADRDADPAPSPGAINGVRLIFSE